MDIEPDPDWEWEGKGSEKRASLNVIRSEARERPVTDSVKEGGSRGGESAHPTRIFATRPYEVLVILEMCVGGNHPGNRRSKATAY